MPIITAPRKSPSQCQRPSGWIGKIVLWSMNRRHSKLTDWGLGHLSIRPDDAVLDVGCGGGRTVAKLAALARRGSVHGVDYAPASIATARKMNRTLVEAGRVGLQEASASALPFAAGAFDLVTAIETHFWWQDLAGGMCEAFRVLKPGGCMAVIAEFYNGGKHAKYADRLACWTTMAVLDVDEHKRMFTEAGFAEVTVDEDAARGWICVIGTKSAIRSARPPHQSAEGWNGLVQ